MTRNRDQLRVDGSGSPITEKALLLLERIEKEVQRLRPPVLDLLLVPAGPFQVLITIMMSSRTRDEVTTAAAARLFAAAPGPREVVNLAEGEIAALIKPVGFFQRKAGQIREIAAILLEKPFPCTLEGLTELPGVGVKTAGLVLVHACSKQAVAVDVHVFRVSRRLGWARAEQAGALAAELRALFPEKDWHRVNTALVGWGQAICRPRNPLCPRCPLRFDCEHGLSQSFSGAEPSK